MELVGSYVMAIVETSGLFAPLLFIVCHLVRPLLFLPVIAICMAGGIFFGTIAGTLYSVVGITLSSMVFYLIIRSMPKTFNHFLHAKQKFLGDHTTFSSTQITLLRLIPFIHFQLLSFCLFEISPNFKEYMKSSFFTSIPATVMYTSIGQTISRLPSTYMVLAIFLFIILIYVFRKREISIKWHEFFSNEAI